MRNWLYGLLFVFVVSACGNKSDSMTNEEKIAGKEEKTWKAQKETDASGDKDKLTRNEKRQTITFWRNGNVKMGDGNEMLSGQWKLEGNNLALVFTGSDVSENFTLVELEDDEMKLRAGDGSELTMKPD
jgi:hypothetical protein